ncbi:MAG: hypothetical protein Ta2E_07280 [Mycoplasmoidaceae bacterium]|nr:MAG: hypothetical protein Ta2E_07280 [Mycoplasmoidaceae bacterium]
MIKVENNKKFDYEFRYIDTRKLLTLTLWSVIVIALGLVLFLGVLPEIEYWGDYQHDNIITIGGKDYSSISTLRKDIGNATIANPEDIAHAYYRLTNWISHSNTSQSPYPIIGFSLMWFDKALSYTSSSASPADRFATLWGQGIWQAYTYICIAFIISCIAFGLMALNFFKLYIDGYRNYRRKITTHPVKTYKYYSFYFDSVTKFVSNVALVFCFFNFLTTLIVIAYWIFFYSIKFMSKKAKTRIISSHFDISTKDLYYLIGIMVFQNLYLVIKSHLIKQYGVNLDVMMAVILPIGTITLVIVIFIRNLMTSKLSKMAKDINEMGKNVNWIRLNIKLKGIDCFRDSKFVELLPSYIQKALLYDDISIKEAQKLITNKITVINFIEANFSKKRNDENYLMYVAYYLVNNEEDLQIFYDNLIKLDAAHDIKRCKKHKQEYKASDAPALI